MTFDIMVVYGENLRPVKSADVNAIKFVTYRQLSLYIGALQPTNCWHLHDFNSSILTLAKETPLNSSDTRCINCLHF